MTLGEAGIGSTVSIQYVGGERSFRRRLMELGLVPGTDVELVSVAPLGDPLRLRVRGCQLSIRRKEALAIQVVLREAENAVAAAPALARSAV